MYKNTGGSANRFFRKLQKNQNRASSFRFFLYGIFFLRIQFELFLTTHRTEA